MKKVVTGLLILLNICGCLCLAYFGYLFVSGSAIVDAPDAMIPMERWERGGLALTIGAIPLIITNTLGYVMLPGGNKNADCFCLFLPLRA